MSENMNPTPEDEAEIRQAINHFRWLAERGALTREEDPHVEALGKVGALVLSLRAQLAAAEERAEREVKEWVEVAAAKERAAEVLLDQRDEARAVAARAGELAVELEQARARVEEVRRAAIERCIAFVEEEAVVWMDTDWGKVCRSLADDIRGSLLAPAPATEPAPLHRCPECGRTWNRPTRCGDCDRNTIAPAPASPPAPPSEPTRERDAAAVLSGPDFRDAVIVVRDMLDATPAMATSESMARSIVDTLRKRWAAALSSAPQGDALGAVRGLAALGAVTRMVNRPYVEGVRDGLRLALGHACPGDLDFTADEEVELRAALAAVEGDGR